MEHNSPTGQELGNDSFIPRQSLTLAVAEKLREKIFCGELREGQQLRQDAIAAEFRVSRIPVREALRHLEAEGLITIVPHHGAVVSALSPDDIEELFDIRALLECDLLRRSIPHLTEEDFVRVEAVMKDFEKDLFEPAHMASWGRLNWQFHSALYAGARRPHFLSVVRNINNNGERYTRLQLYLTRGVERAKQEHRELLELCRKRDVDAACELLQRHITHAGQSLKQVLQERRTEEKAGR